MRSNEAENVCPLLSRLWANCFLSILYILFIYLLNQKSAVTLQNMPHIPLSPSVRYQEISDTFPRETCSYERVQGNWEYRLFSFINSHHLGIIHWCVSFMKCTASISKHENSYLGYLFCILDSCLTFFAIKHTLTQTVSFVGMPKYTGRDEWRMCWRAPGMIWLRMKVNPFL